MRTFIGIVARLIFWLTAIYFVGAMALVLFVEGKIVYMVLSLAFFPITYFLYPLMYGQWWLLLISITSYAVSTLYGKLEPVE